MKLKSIYQDSGMLSLILIGLLFPFQNIFGKTLKVCEDCPYKTIQSAIEKAVPGDTVMVYEGIYHESLTITKSGSEEKPIVILAKPGDLVILDGSVMLKDWKKCESVASAKGNPNWNKLYFRNAPKGSNRLNINLFQGEERLYVAQMPEALNPFYDENTKEWIPTSKETNYYSHSTIRDNKNLNQKENDFWKGAYAKIVSGNNEVFIQKITGFSAPENMLVFEPLFADTVELEPGKDVYAISNHISLLDKPGEMYFDEEERNIYIIPFENESVNESISGSVLQYAFKAENKSNVIIDGFVIQKYYGVNISLDYCSNITLKNCEIKDGIVKEDGGIGPSIYVKYSNNCIVDNCFIHHNKHVRGIIFTDGMDNLITNTRFTHTGGTAIDYYGETGSVLDANYLYDCIGQHANGLTCYLGCKDIIIKNNIVINSNIGLTFYDIDGLTVVNNVFHGGGKYWATACWNGESSLNVAFYNNIMIGSNKRKQGFFSLGSLPDLVMKNNIMDGNVHSGDQISNNLYTYISDGQNIKNEDGAIYIHNGESKIFVDPETFDFRLKQNSPAIHNGVDIGLEYDISNKKRNWGGMDIGPYKYEE